MKGQAQFQVLISNPSLIGPQITISSIVPAELITSVKYQIRCTNLSEKWGHIEAWDDFMIAYCLLFFFFGSI